MKQKFLNIFSEYFENSKLSKLIVSSPLSSSEFKSVTIRPFDAKKGRVLSWVYRYLTKDVTKNYSLEESSALLEELIGVHFRQADLYGTEDDYFLKAEGKMKLTRKASTVEREVSGTHNKEKKRTVALQEPFLELLGVTAAGGHLKKDKKDKYIQINKFLEFFSHATSGLGNEHMHVLDMGSGKGYLTFAVYHHLSQRLKNQPQVRGVEYREDMVTLCNGLADKAGFQGLRFEQGSIDAYPMPQVDVLIALHACDTATDDALYKGIAAGAQVILVSPCCHKQVRKALNLKGLATIYGKYGIIEERKAEMLTDLIRAAVLEICGYQTQVFEFVNADNSPKNLMITAVKKRESQAHVPAAWKEIEELKGFYGLEYQHLERAIRQINLI
jgi:SAM-dependent methyltransferase